MRLRLAKKIEEATGIETRANDSIIIDITTPDYCVGKDYAGSGKQVFCIPFESDIGELSINIFIEE